MSVPFSREQAVSIGRQTHAIVQSYINAQNSLFKFSFAKVFGFRHPDPKAAADQVAPLLGQVQSLLATVREFKLDPRQPLDNFAIVLTPYLRAIAEAMEFFIAFCGRMEAPRTDTTYWKVTYKRDLEDLQARERAYLEIGLELNKRWALCK